MSAGTYEYCNGKVYISGHSVPQKVLAEILNEQADCIRELEEKLANEHRAMNQMEYRFQFSPNVDLDEAVGTLRLSLLAAEGPYGEARVRTEVSFTVEPVRAEIRVSGATGVLEAVTQIFTALLSHEFGRDTFTIRREAAEKAR